MIELVLCDSTRGRSRVLGGRHVTVRQLVSPNAAWFVCCEILPDGKISRTEIVGLVSSRLGLDKCGCPLTTLVYPSPSLFFVVFVRSRLFTSRVTRFLYVRSDC